MAGTYGPWFGIGAVVSLVLLQLPAGSAYACRRTSPQEHIAKFVSCHCRLLLVHALLGSEHGQAPAT
jgi:hypothetical protein